MPDIHSENTHSGHHASHSQSRTMCSSKGKVDHTPVWSVGGVLISLSVVPEVDKPLFSLWRIWPTWRQTYGYLPGRRASPPFGRYQIILLGDRGTWVLPRVVAWWWAGQESNRRPFDHESDTLSITTTKPPCAAVATVILNQIMIKTATTDRKSTIQRSNGVTWCSFARKWDAASLVTR